jgi:alpha/beta superfamily hydrolase
LVHGTGSNFYSSTLFDALAGRLVELGCGVLRANTRGHDGISTAVTSRGGRRLGAAYELVDDCRHDIRAWLDWLRDRAGPRIGLIGHSLGAVKCLYSVAHDGNVQPECVVAISPPRLSYSWFCASENRIQFLSDFHRAEALVSAGEPDALLEVKLPLAYLTTAAGYVEKYGPDERYNFVKFLDRVRCPALVTLGEIEVANNMAFRTLPTAIAESSATKVSVEVIAGADHFYTSTRPELIDRVTGWLSRLSGHGESVPGRQKEQEEEK